MTQGKEEKNKDAVINNLKCVEFLTRQKLAVSENTEKIMKFVKHFAELLKWNLFELKTLCYLCFIQF